MSNASVYFELSSDVKVKPLMLALPLASPYTDGTDVNNWTVWSFREKSFRGYQ